MSKRRYVSLIAALAALAAMHPASPARAKADFSIDPVYEARFERAYTTQFPSRWTNQVRPSAWRTSHDASALFIRDEWRRLLKPFASEGAFAELRPFNFADPTGRQDNQDPFGIVGPENNVLAFVPGADPALRNQIVIIGGHYDCVDVVVDGGLDCGMQIPVSTAVLEGLVRYWEANNLRPRRSLALFAIDGEEQCLCGSVHYTTLGSVNALAHHLELPPALQVVAYHDTDMIGANYPNRLFGLSSNDFMPLNVFSAPSLDDPERVLAPFAAYHAATANPAFLAKFKLYRRAVLAQRDRFFADMHTKYPTWTYRDGVTKPLFTADQKKYINITDDPLDRSDHTIFISQGVPSDINIGLNDPNAAPPGWLSYHHPGETQEEINYFRGGDMSLNRDSLLGYEATAAWIAYLSGAGEDSDPTMPFFIGETAPGGLPAIQGVSLDTATATLPEMPASEVGGPWRSVGLEDTIVRALSIDKREPGTLYVASQDKGFLVSRDGGNTFTPSNAGLDGFTSLWQVIPDPNVAQRLWVATHHGGVFRSDDGGRTWRSTRSAASASAKNATFAKPSDPVDGTDLLSNQISVDQKGAQRAGVWLYVFDQCLAQYAPAGQKCATRADWPAEGFDRHAPVAHYYRYASDLAVAGDGDLLSSGFSTYQTPGGTFRAANAGATWTFTWVNSDGGSPGDSNLWRLRSAGARRIYAAGTGGVFRSDNGGRTWAAFRPTTEIRALAVDPTDADVVYAGSWNENGGIFKSTDGGATWTRTSEGLPARAGIAALEVDASDPKRIAAATYWYGVYLSTDGGASWKLTAEGMPDKVRQRLDDVDFAADGTLYASSHHGIWALSGPGSKVLGRKVTNDDRMPTTGVGDAYPAWVLLALAAALATWRRRGA